MGDITEFVNGLMSLQREVKAADLLKISQEQRSILLLAEASSARINTLAGVVGVSPSHLGSSAAGAGGSGSAKRDKTKYTSGESGGSGGVRTSSKVSNFE